MKKLEVPIEDDSNVFKDCVEAYCHKKRYELQPLTKIVNELNKDYREKMPNKYDLIKFPKYTDEQKKQMLSIYEYQFVNKRVGGYYDKLLENAKNLCPFCGEQIPSNLDHFLPKAEYPFLAVTPENLIPSCRDCNMEKGAEKPVYNSDIPLYPYYDDIKDIWLGVKLDFNDPEHINVLFYNCFDSGIDHVLAKRIDAHMRVHNLQYNFSSHAMSMINSKKRLHKKKNERSLDVLLEDLKEELISFEEEDVNSWRAALYRGLIERIKDYSTWLIKFVDVND